MKTFTANTMNIQLLLTFTTPEELSLAIDDIIKCYELPEQRIYALLNVDDPKQILLTYNAITKGTFRHPLNTISVHRKKQTNTLYTINALNDFIYKTTGQINKQYEVNWEELRNTVLVMAYKSYKLISTELLEIIELN